MTFSSLPPRTKRMKRTPFQRKSGASQGGFSPAGEHSPIAARKAAPETGFTYAQRMDVRKRAGNGEIDDAHCEACPRWLGRYGGQVHHRCNRQMGGSKLRNRLSNAVLVCGTSETGCHGECTALDKDKRAQGFVLDSGQDPLAESILLHGQQGGVRLDDFGHYLDADGYIIGGAL